MAKKSIGLIERVSIEFWSPELADFTIRAKNVLNSKVERYRNSGERTSAIYLDWRIKCLERDKRKCVSCGSRKSLHVHHVKPYLTFPELRVDINNGITLCQECHKSAHKTRQWTN